jgi:squalene-associated FAD-dependent desaturase
LSSGTQDVVVVGGGLAGLAAATALAEDGAQVTVVERRPEVGGRVYSYEHPALGEVVDSQHVLLGCCTNLLDLVGKAGGGDLVRWYDELTFLEPNGNRSVMKPSGLPAPLHQTMSFLRARMLGVQDKMGIARGLLEFLRGYPAEDGESFATWLVRTAQTERAIRHFWEPVVVGALNDTFERCSTKYAGKVFHETFLRSEQGGRLGIPRVPLTEFLVPVRARAEALGVRFERMGVDGVERRGGDWVVRSGGLAFPAEKVVVATGLKEAMRLVPAAIPAGLEERLVHAPITTVHLWYDRDVTGLDHAVLLDTRIQWVFAKSRIRGWEAERGSYLELTISASWAELKRGREEILRDALRELELFFPEVREAELLKSGVLKEARATFSVTPGLDAFRPEQETALPGLFLAGDWTQTEWPSTMEGAVRSGRLAAGAVRGDRLRFMTAEVPASGLMKLIP